MAVVAHAHPFVVGVDTHARNHAVSVLVRRQGLVPQQRPARHGRSHGSGTALAATPRRSGRSRAHERMENMIVLLGMSTAEPQLHRPHENYTT